MLAAVDAVFTRTINGPAGSFAISDMIMVGLAQWAVFLIVGSIALRWWFFTPRPAQRFAAVSCGFATAIGLGLNQIVLLFVNRIRPYDAGVSHLIVGRSTDPSFPSDHATVVVAIAIMLWLLKDRLRYHYGMIALCVSYSRVFIGMHYVGDVLGGMVTAAAAAILVRSFYRQELAINGFLLKLF